MMRGRSPRAGVFFVCTSPKAVPERGPRLDAKRPLQPPRRPGEEARKVASVPLKGEAERDGEGVILKDVAYATQHQRVVLPLLEEGGGGRGRVRHFFFQRLLVAAPPPRQGARSRLECGGAAGEQPQVDLCAVVQETSLFSSRRRHLAVTRRYPPSASTVHHLTEEHVRQVIWCEAIHFVGTTRRANDSVCVSCTGLHHHPPQRRARRHRRYRARLGVTRTRISCVGW